jgi:hypothetical protein
LCIENLNSLSNPSWSGLGYHDHVDPTQLVRHVHAPAPSAAKVSAMARPIPLVPPVTAILR